MCIQACRRSKKCALLQGIPAQPGQQSERQREPTAQPLNQAKQLQLPRMAETRKAADSGHLGNVLGAELLVGADCRFQELPGTNLALALAALHLLSVVVARTYTSITSMPL